LPVDWCFQFVHPDRSFMHPAYMILMSFQSPDSEAARPMLHTDALVDRDCRIRQLGGHLAAKALRRKF
jgi:hypothetical protein